MNQSIRQRKVQTFPGGAPSQTFLFYGRSFFAERWRPCCSLWSQVRGCSSDVTSASKQIFKNFTRLRLDKRKRNSSERVRHQSMKTPLLPIAMSPRISVTTGSQLIQPTFRNLELSTRDQDSQLPGRSRQSFSYPSARVGTATHTRYCCAQRHGRFD